MRYLGLNYQKECRVRELLADVGPISLQFLKSQAILHKIIKRIVKLSPTCEVRA